MLRNVDSASRLEVLFRVLSSATPFLLCLFIVRMVGLALGWVAVGLIYILFLYTHTIKNSRH